MRLLVAETPQRWHLGVAGEARVFRHDRRRIAGSNEEDIERPFCVGVGNKFALRPAEVECPEGLMDEHRPTLGSDQPGNGHSSAMGVQAIAALPADHAIGGTSAVELRSALTQPEQRRSPGRERNAAGFGIDRELLNFSPRAVHDSEAERIGGNLHVHFADANRLCFYIALQACSGLAPVFMQQGTIVRYAPMVRKDGQPEGVLADRNNLDVEAVIPGNRG